MVLYRELCLLLRFQIDLDRIALIPVICHFQLAKQGDKFQVSSIS